MDSGHVLSCICVILLVKKKVWEDFNTLFSSDRSCTNKHSSVLIILPLDDYLLTIVMYIVTYIACARLNPLYRSRYKVMTVGEGAYKFSCKLSENILWIALKYLG